jgi:hypothetical protein
MTQNKFACGAHVQEQRICHADQNSAGSLLWGERQLH